MESVRSAAGAVCAGLIALGVIGVLVPDGKNRGLIRTVFVVFTLLCVITPIYKAVREVDLTGTGGVYASGSEFANTAALKTAELSADLVAAEAERLLSSAGFDDCEISADMDIDGSGGISIKGITVLCDSGYDAGTIRAALSGGFGIAPETVEVKTYG